MRLEFASVALMLCACTQPTVPHPQSQAASTAAGASGGGAAAGTGAPEMTGKGQRTKRPEQAPDLDAGTGDDDPDEAMEPTTITDAGRPGPTTDASVVSGGESGAAAMPPVDAGPVAPDAVGTWYGPNEDALGRESTACVILNQVGMVGPAGDTRYTGALNCTGRISFVETVDGVHSFEEVATSGVGCPSGILRLTPLADGTLKFNFFFNRGDIPDGIGILHRVDECP